jgi:class II flagellar assembly regulator FliX
LEVGGPRRVESSSVRRTGRPASSATGNFVAEEIHEARAATLTGAAPIGAVDTILALQGIEDSTDERRRGVQHGDEMLKLLDEVRDGLLAGGIPRATLHRLAAATSKRRDGFADPKLQIILDEIELRARVELAKLEQAEKPQF